MGSSLIFVENCHNLLVGQGGGGVGVQGGHLQLSPDGGVQHRDVVRAVRDEHPILGKLLGQSCFYYGFLKIFLSFIQKFVLSDFFTTV